MHAILRRCPLQVLSSRTGKQLSTLKLQKPAGWRPNPAAAAQRFVSLQQQRLKATPANKASLASSPVDSLEEDVDAFIEDASTAPDFDGLNQLLQEELLTAAATTPSVSEKFAGPNSYMAKVVAAMSTGEAPSPVRAMSQASSSSRASTNT